MVNQVEDISSTTTTTTNASLNKSGSSSIHSETRSTNDDHHKYDSHHSIINNHNDNEKINNDNDHHHLNYDEKDEYSLKEKYQNVQVSLSRIYYVVLSLIFVYSQLVEFATTTTISAATAEKKILSSS